MKTIKTFLIKVINFIFPRSIYLFHHIDTCEECQNVSINEFDKFLTKKKFVSLETLLEKDGLCSICFDDGCSDVYFVAFPILKCKSIPFTIFLNPSTIDSTGFLKKTQILEMINSGLCTIGSHGYDHIDLDSISYEEAISELTKSKEYLEKSFGTEVNYYAYPHGKHTKEIIRFLKKSHLYKYAFSVSVLNVNWFSNKFKMPRININKNNIGRF